MIASEREAGQTASRCVRLEPLVQQHGPGLEALAVDRELRRHTPVRARPPAGFASSWIDTFERGRVDGTRDGFAILNADDGSFLGVAAAICLDEVTSEAELVCLLGAEARHRGVATEALRLLTDWGFARGLHRLELRVCTDDVAMQRAAGSCGYRREGLLRSAHFSEGRRSDMVVYARLSRDA